MYANKMDNLKEMEKFLEKLNLPRLNKVETEIMNNPITRSEIETVILKSSKNKVHDQMASQANFIKYLEES